MVQIGIDFGGTKIEAAALDEGGQFLSRLRVPNPGDYDRAVRDVRDLVLAVEAEAGALGTIGIGTPGSISPRTGLMRNANSLYLNGRTFREDLETAMARPVRMANDANCLALSEAVDGAAAGARSAFAIIVGTGCGGGLVIDGRIVEGANGIAGEWGHVPLPWPTGVEVPGPACWCGLHGCLESWVSGTGFRRDHESVTGQALDGAAIMAAARAGNADATATLDRYIDRLGRALALIANLIDPDCFVLGGGMSNVVEIYDRLPAVVRSHTFSDGWDAKIVQAVWGDSSGVRGAARLWPT
ncbi:N-acetylglucosamine kinase [Sphingomonas sp. PP-F2F-G114-C0414]|uniref:ROK family protein n=1 Tax=Sphingomonas sp. PP-F2F-G114-C0414 TaxID=2135662 RepID=UPI000EF937D8|nr:ROK family protein [Sphingomonas sp. PP-F2F-G114-C0414]RMB37019.1 N-acetylglucosamine kinase [Sphingomonas sp. PP-F2F-G114-C0414]